MGKKLITLEKATAVTDSISKIGLEYIELAANANNPPTVKQNTKFHIVNSSGISRYILETGDQSFSWGTGDFPVISDGTWYLYCTEAQGLGNVIPAQGTYGASKNVPTYFQEKNAFYNSDGRVIGRFTVSASVVSGILVINLVDITGDISISGNITSTINQTDTTESTTKDTGAIITDGGLGVEKNINAGGAIKSSIATASTDKDTGAIISEGGIGAEKDISSGGAIRAAGGFEVEYRNSVGSESKVLLHTKIIEIGDWNMDATITVAVVHGIADFKKIRTVTVMIRNNTDSIYHPFIITDNSGADLHIGGWINFVNSTTVSLDRITGGLFDTTSYNSTSYNRGWITIVYEA